MSLFLATILGFLIGLLSFTFFSPFSFLALAASYAYCLYLLFFSTTPRLPTLFLIGLTISIELLGTSRLGQASFLAIFIYILYYLFQQRLRFTSLFVRYIVALFLSLIGYSLFLFSFHSILTRLEYLLLAYPIFAFISYSASSFQRRHDYELI